MKKLIATVISCAALLLSGGTAFAASANTNGWYSTPTSPGGQIQCAGWNDTIGEALAPNWLYVDIHAIRHKNLWCQDPWPVQFEGDLQLNYQIWAYSVFGGVWYQCKDWLDYNVTGDYGTSDFQFVQAFPGCGVTYYHLEVDHGVRLWDGIRWRLKVTPPVDPIWLNG